ncbi:MAG: recombinase family protein [Gemmataceae bacterium]
MASLFRPSKPHPLPPDAEIIDRDGKPHVRIKDKGKTVVCPLTKDGTKYLKPAAKWYGKYRDADGNLQKPPLSSSKEAALTMLSKLLDEVDRERAGQRDPFKQHRKTPLTTHVAEWLGVLKARGRDEEYIALKKARVTAILDGCGFVFACDMAAEPLERFLESLRTGEKKLSVQTTNDYLQATSQFCNWMVENNRMERNPFARVQKGNAERDRRHIRRPLSITELQTLITSTKAKGKVRRKLPAESRAVLYAVAAYSGYRAGELACLTPDNFQLDGDTPTIELSGEHTKNGKDASQPIPADLVPMLRAFLDAIPAGTPCWAGTWSSRSADLIRDDAAEAGLTLDVDSRDGTLVLDFHSLRGTYATLLDGLDVSLKTRQELMRHSDPRLTMNRYTRVQLHDLGAAIQKLPALANPTPPPTAESGVLRMTGTDGGCTADVPGDVPAEGKGLGLVRTVENIPTSEQAAGKRNNPLENQGVECGQGPSRTVESGEGGIRSRPPTQVLGESQSATKRQFRQAVASLLMVAIICGCWVSFGNVFSTVSAQSVHSDSAIPSALSSRVRGRCRRDENSSTSRDIAASYARYSSDLQDASSIEQQQRKCREAAAQNDHDLKTEFEFADSAMSGTRVDRAGLQAMLAAAREGRFRVLYFESLSRLAREFIISMPVLKELVYVHKIRIISTSEGIDSDRAGWELMAMIRSWMHGEFLTALRSAVLRGQEGAILDDYSVGDWCLGYGSEPIPGSEAGRRGRNPRPRMRVIIREEHAVWVRRIFHWYVVERRSLIWIARELTRLKAPKDHRSTTTEWRHCYVVGVLRSPKYIGIWPWGAKTNVRNPLTGRVHQEDRPPEEAAKYQRERPHLRLVDDEMYFLAQGLLDENEAKLAAVRQKQGRLRGSTKDLANPRHLLQGVVKCGACGSIFKVAGAHGKYLECGGYRTGRCQLRTRLRRDLAERLLLGVIGDRILRNPLWHQTVLEAALASWSARCANRPDEATEVNLALAAVEQRISRLLDAIESGESGADVRDRLAARRREREELVRRRDAVQRNEGAVTTPPTAEWVADQLRRLDEVLTGPTPAAGVALRNLVGSLVVSEAGSGSRKRKHLRGTFTLRTATAIELPGGGRPTNSEVHGETVTLDFTSPPPWTVVADAVKEMYDAGVRFEEMTTRLNCHPSWPAKALAHWHCERGLPTPDGRSTRDRLTANPAFTERVSRVKELWDQGLLMHEIATVLGCCRDTVTAAIKYWHTSRNLPVPDGQARRKELPRKSQTED